MLGRFFFCAGSKKGGIVRSYQELLSFACPEMEADLKVLSSLLSLAGFGTILQAPLRIHRMVELLSFPPFCCASLAVLYLGVAPMLE